MNHTYRDPFADLTVALDDALEHGSRLDQTMPEQRLRYIRRCRAQLVIADKLLDYLEKITLGDTAD